MCVLLGMTMQPSMKRSASGQASAYKILSPPVFRPSVSEVADLFETSLGELLDPDSVREEFMTRENREWPGACRTLDREMKFAD